MVTTATAVISRNPETIATEIDGEVMLMSLITGRTFGLDKRGSRIWELIEQPLTVSELVGKLLARYETTSERCQADVLDFVGKMESNQLATISEPGVANAPQPA